RTAGAWEDIETFARMRTVGLVESARQCAARLGATLVEQAIDFVPLRIAVGKDVVPLVLQSIQSPLLEQHDAARGFTLAHQVEAAIDLVEGDPVRDLRVDLDLAFHEEVDQP